MENILDVYARPYNSRHPVICMDEVSKELHKQVKEPLETQVGKVKKEDYNYERNGVANLFVFLEPLAGKRYIVVSESKTRFDWSEAIQFVVETYYGDVNECSFVMDNYSTHKPSAFYETFTPEKAGALRRMINFEYTPTHASWLNAVELENSVLARQVLNQRIGSIEELQKRIKAFEEERNRKIIGVDWQFTTEDARIKLKRLYPTFIFEQDLSIKNK